MKIMTILGTRLEITRPVLIIQKFVRCCQQLMVHTGQNHLAGLKGILF